MTGSPPDPASHRAFFGGFAELARYCANGAVASLLFYLLYEALYAWVPWSSSAAPWSWGVAYAVSILWTHRFHRASTFRWPTPYWTSLRRTYALYGTSLCVTTILDYVLVEVFGWPHRGAWLFTLCASGTWNYFVLRNWSFRIEGESS